MRMFHSNVENTLICMRVRNTHNVISDRFRLLIGKLIDVAEKESKSHAYVAEEIVISGG